MHSAAVMIEKIPKRHHHSLRQAPPETPRHDQRIALHKQLPADGSGKEFGVVEG